MKVPFLDLRVTAKSERTAILKAVAEVLDHGRLVMGPEISEYEKEVAEFCEREYAVSASSGTGALYLALRALDVGPGDEVITTSLSWIATANAIALCGATPVFADIRNDLNIDPISVKRLITPATKAILPVNYTGKICEMSAIEEIARKNNLYVIEDGSQSFGATLSGRKCGNFGLISCISNNPMKVFAACGEAGTVLCDDKSIYKRLVSLRYNGTADRETCFEASFNGRMDTIQAAILLVRIKKISKNLDSRKKNAKLYHEGLKGFVKTPVEEKDSQCVYYTYTIRSTKRDQLKEFLSVNGIETKIQHKLLMPKHPAYNARPRGEWSNAEILVKQILSVPVHEKMKRSEVLFVVDQIRKFGPNLPD
jgi:dTDP-4-amino-4,6-dideoxygalactose transaminase